MPKSSSSNMTDNELNTNQLGLTKTRSRLVVLTVLLLYFLCGMLKTIQAPFYPEEAISKNLTAKEYGLALGSFDITQCLASIPLIPVVFTIGPKLSTLSGTAVTGACMLSFGFLKYCNSRMVFFTLSFALRILEGIGKSFLNQGALNIVSITSTFGVTWLESAYGIGLVISPAIGGFLFDLSDFQLPFTFLGTLLMLTLPLSTYLIPSDHALKKVGQKEKSLNFEVLRVGGVWFGFLIGVLAMVPLAYFTAHLGPYLEIFYLNATYRGLIFYLLGVFYAGSSPMWGKLCERGLDVRLCVAITALFSSVGICLVGPVPFIPLQTSLALLIFGVILSGIGIGGCMPLAFVYSRQACDKKGIPNNTSSNTILTGLYFSSTSLGAFLGSSLGGVVHDILGFKKTSLIVFGSNAAIPALGLLIHCKGKHKNNVDES